MKIHPDGIYFNMSFEDYLADPALGSSDIKSLLQSPATFWAKSHMNPNKMPREETDALAFGTLLHEVILENPDKALAVKPDGMSFARKDGKAWRDEQQAAGLPIITHTQSMELNSVKATLKAAGVAERLAGGVAEVSYFWTVNGFRCKIRLDSMKATESFDLKSFAVQGSKELETTIAHATANFKYHISGFWYRQGIDHMVNGIRKGTAILQDVEEQQAIIKAITAITAPHRHWYIFLEKGGVPNVVCREYGPRDEVTGQLNEYWKSAQAGVNYATNRYAENMKKFGFDGTPWIEPAKWQTFGDEEFGSAPWVFR